MSITNEIFPENPTPSGSSDVFNRLFEDSSKRQQSKQSIAQEPPKAEPKGPRNKIENDLMERHAMLQAKLRKKRAEYNAEQDREITGTPQINSNSKKIIQGEKIKKQEVIKPKPKKGEIMPAVVTNLRKSVRRPTLHSAASASVLFSEESPEKVDVVVNLSKFQMTLEEQQEEKNKLQAGQRVSSPNGIAYESVNDRMNLNEKLQPDEELMEEPKYLEAERDVVKRAMYWHIKKEERIEKERKEKEAKELDGCTFTPTLNASKTELNGENRSEMSRCESYSEIYELRRELENEDLPREPKNNETMTYRPLSPSKIRLGYQTGFNMQNFSTRAQPMLNYKSLQ